MELKRQIEKKVLAAYPYSAPMLVIRACGVFPVYVQGEVATSNIVFMWGLSRLAELWSGVTPYASTRDVKVADEKGTSTSYDLFKFWRYGDLSQNPYLKPSQRVSIGKYDRLVTVTGEVHRPGSYQILPGEGLDAVLNRYGEGITDKGNPDGVTITRLKSALSEQGEFINLQVKQGSELALQNLDMIAVSSKIDWLPSVYFEGAIGAKGDEAAGVAASNRINYPFFTGEMLSNAVFALRNSFTPVSDLRKAYLIRGSTGVRLPIDLAKFITDHDFSDDLKLEKNDYIIIPFRQYFITVGGAVMIPGRYPYVPDRTWKYYVNLAGGIDSDRNANNVIRITDSADKVRSEDVMIQPEDKIYVPANSALHFLTQISGIVSLAVSTLTLFLSLKSIIGF
jgi:polysaccharide biosynthesis/export protein